MRPTDSDEWRKLLDDHPPISLPGWEGERVFVSLAARDSIYEQLLALKGQRVVDLVPADKEDWEKYTKRTTLPGHWKNWKPEEHEAARKIGVLTDVAKNVDNYMSPLNTIFGKVSIDKKFQDFQWKAYTLYIGLHSSCNKYDYERAEDGWYPKDWKNGFTISECKVKGVYFMKDRTSNDHDSDTSLRNYYHLRGIWMYVYLPGRSYW